MTSRMIENQKCGCEEDIARYKAQLLCLEEKIQKNDQELVEIAQKFKQYMAIHKEKSEQFEYQAGQKYLYSTSKTKFRGNLQNIIKEQEINDSRLNSYKMKIKKIEEL